nr:uncharacterized protein LOC127330201 [Lolium perenne]
MDHPPPVLQDPGPPHGQQAAPECWIPIMAPFHRPRFEGIWYPVMQLDGSKSKCNLYRSFDQDQPAMSDQSCFVYFLSQAAHHILMSSVPSFNLILYFEPVSHYILVVLLSDVSFGGMLLQSVSSTKTMHIVFNKPWALALC